MTDKSSVITEELRNSAEKLELDQLLEIIAANACSPRSHSGILDPVIFVEPASAEESRSDIRDVCRLFERGEDIPLSGWKDSGPFLEKVTAPGAVLSGEELAMIAAAERKVAEVQRFISSRVEKLPRLSRYSSRLVSEESVARNIEKAIGDDFEVRDNASPELLSIRKRSVSLKNRVRKEFADFASSRGKGKGNEFVSIRGDRFVVSVSRSDSSAIRGLVHHSSGSGASLFIEPLEFIEKNNMLESLLREEEKEVGRILARLTGEVYSCRERLLKNQEALVELDMVRAKALFSSEYACTDPVHSTDGRMLLRQARHPLLERRLRGDRDGNRIIGLDIDCDGSLSVLVISGPNAGGKTVALKTVGIIIMMDRRGLPVPCLEGSILPFYGNVFVDIGDDQSIERSLSTFSSRIARIVRILGVVDRSSLVLIDEIGDGTDPQEGAAIGCALLEELSSLCGRTIVTTHMSTMKGWAHDMEGAGNATLEFDPAAMRPLYRMKMGVPGRSWGIEMAGRMGLPDQITDRARSLAGEEAVRLEELLGHLESMARMLEKERAELLAREEELSGLVSAYRDRVDTFDKKKDEMEDSARREALAIVTKTRVEMENLVREIRRSQAERPVIRESKKVVEKKRESFEKRLKKEKKQSIDYSKVVEGLEVTVLSLDRSGRIVSVKSRAKIVVELPGGMRVETAVGDLTETTKKKRPRRGKKTVWMGGTSEPVSPELMVRGMERAEAMEEVDAYIDKAVLQGLDTVRIIHGIGRGILKRAVYDMLKKDPRVADIHPGDGAVGGDGVAVVKLK